jgi:hypothetical protein
VDLTHIMFMGFAKQPISCTSTDKAKLKRKVQQAVQAIHGHWVLQGDPEARNQLLDGDLVTIVGFERVTITRQPCRVLEELSSNRKRKRDDDNMEGPSKNDNIYLREPRRAMRAVEDL